MGGAKAKARAKEKAKAEAVVEEEIVVPSIPAEDIPEPPEAKKEAKSWRVCIGKSVTSLRGIIGGGERVESSDFSGGSDTMDSLEQRKIIEMK